MTPAKLRNNFYYQYFPISPPLWKTLQVMLILIYIDVQYLQYIDFSFEKGLSGQNHPSSGSYYLEKKFPPQENFPFGDDHWGNVKIILCYY